MPPSEGALMKNEETFFKGWQKSYRAYMLSYFGHVQLFVTLWTVAFQAPLSMGFSRQEYWSGLPFPSPGDLPDTGIKPVSLMSSALEGGFFTLVPPSGSVVSDSAAPWTVTRQAPLSMGIFPNKGSNPGLLHCRWVLYCLSHQGSPWEAPKTWDPMK